MPRKLSSPKDEERICKRNWAFIAYPDSAPENWQEILQKAGLQCAVSPLHDADVRADESEKKKHWHVMACWPGPTTYNVAAKLSASVNASLPQPVESMKGYYRYLTHEDDADKVQYDKADIIKINGFDIREYVEMTKTEVNRLKRDIMRFVEEHDIIEYCDLLVELDKYDLGDMWDVAANNTIFADAYIRSRRHKLEAIERSKQ
jgi:hypothetical protein